MKTIGKKIRQLREEKCITRAAFCGDESELSIRQLVRLEQGKSMPSFSTLGFVSERLSLPLYCLMPDYREFPRRYQELKYLILRQPAYGVPELIGRQEAYLDEIFEHYYEELPEDEQLVVDYLQATVQLLLTRELSYAKSVVEEGMLTLFEKSYLTLNDLSFLRLLALYFYQTIRDGLSLSPKEVLFFETTVIKLLEQPDFFSPDNLFIYANTLFACLNYYNKVENYALFPKAILVLRQIVLKTEDFQKKPLIRMLEWKDALFNQRDFGKAEHHFQKSYAMAQLLDIQPMVKGLLEEWEEDMEKYQAKSLYRED
jgi:transcriptional regulator with XRE-family HTH domain